MLTTALVLILRIVWDTPIYVGKEDHYWNRGYMMTPDERDISAILFTIVFVAVFAFVLFPMWPQLSVASIAGGIFFIAGILQDHKEETRKRACSSPVEEC